MPVEFLEVLSWECDMDAMTNDAFYAFYLHDLHKEKRKPYHYNHSTATETNEVT